MNVLSTLVEIKLKHHSKHWKAVSEHVVFYLQRPPNGEKIVRAKGDGWYQGNSDFQMQQNWHTCEVTDTLQPEQVQARS